jgi:hypothetical protein
MNNNRVYVAGPMRGHHRFNFPAFFAMSELLTAHGFVPVNPAQLDIDDGYKPEDVPEDWDWNQYPPGFSADDVVDRDLKAIMTCDNYIMLPGWEKSTGARAEKGVLDWRRRQRLDFVDGKFVAWEAEKGNPKDKFGLAKAPLRLLPPIALIQLAQVMAVGAGKYGDVNWRKDRPRTTVYVEAMFRHLFAYLDGQDNDEETGLPHVAHAMANCAILLDANACETLIDDRAKSGKVADMLRKKG